MLHIFVVILLTLFTKNIRSKEITNCAEIIREKTDNSMESLIKSYETSVNTAIKVDKSDDSLLNSWTAETQMALVNLTTTFRIQMIQYKDYHFDSNYNVKRQCPGDLKTVKKRTESDYYVNEARCMKAAMQAGDEKRLSILQLKKEIRKWRRSYRYLRNLCNRTNPGDQLGAGSCLVDYIEKDNYSEVLTRLIALKSQAMSELHSTLIKSAVCLEDCLKSSLTNYLSRIESHMIIWC